MSHSFVLRPKPDIASLIPSQLLPDPSQLLYASQWVQIRELTENAPWLAESNARVQLPGSSSDRCRPPKSRCSAYR